MITQLSYSFTTSSNILEGNLKPSAWSKLDNFLVGRIKEQSQKETYGPQYYKANKGGTQYDRTAIKICSHFKFLFLIQPQQLQMNGKVYTFP